MNLKTNKGITLIALVITIIVLLILAGVTISMVLGDDGIITNATKAKEETEKVEYPERVRMAVASALVAGKGKGVNLDANPPVSEKSEDDNSVKNALEKEFGTEFGTVVTYTEGEKEGEIKVKKGALNQTFTVTAKGTVIKDDGAGDAELGGETDEIITFTYVGDGSINIQCQAYEGDTWAEWLESDLANDDFVIDDYGFLFYVDSSGVSSSQVDGVSVNGYGVYLTSSDGVITEAKPTSDIIANQQYCYPYT